MVNRYDTPAQAEFMNTYVPIPFEQMYNLGQQAKQDVDKAIDTLSNTYDKWSDFRSPSQVDTQAWYDNTIGRLAPVVNKLSSNMDYLKSAAGRSELYTALNNLDYAKLGNLKQSRDAMLAGQEYRQRLAAAGKYNPNWHDVDFSNYDTLGNNAIFDDISPLAYTSIQQMVDPYVSGLKDSFINSEGGYDYFGVTPDQIAGVVDQNLSGIMTTPEAQQHMTVWMRQNPGATTSDAQTWFRNKAVQDSQQYARVNRQENRFALASQEYQQRLALANASGRGRGNGGSNGSEEELPPSPALLTDQLAVVGKETLNQRILDDRDGFMNVRQAWLNNDFSDKTMQTAISQDARNQFMRATGTPIDKTEDFNMILRGTSEVLDNFASPINRAATDVILGTASVGKREIGLGLGEEYLLPNSRELELPVNFATGLMNTTVKRGTGKKGEDNLWVKFGDALTAGQFDRVGVQPTGEQFAYVENGKPRTAIKVRVSIPVAEMDRVGFEKVRKDSDGYIESDKDGNQYYIFDAIKKIPDDGATKSFINQEYLNTQTSKTYGNQVYERNQELSFDLPY